MAAERLGLRSGGPRITPEYACARLATASRQPVLPVHGVDAVASETMEKTLEEQIERTSGGPPLTGLSHLLALDQTRRAM